MCRILSSTSLGTLASLVMTLPVLAEGSNQIGIGSNGLNVYLFEYDANNSFIQAPNQRPIYVNIFNPGEVINLSLCGWESWNDLGIEIFDPDGVLIFADSGSPGSKNGNRWRLSQGNVTTSSGNLCNHGSSTNNLRISTPNSPLTSPVRYTTTKTGTYEIRLYNESKSNTNSNAVFSYFDITVTPNSSTNPDPTENQGRVWARSWAFNAGNTFSSSGAYDANFYVRTPGGRPNTEFIWQLDLNQFAPQRHEIIGNSIGLNAPYSRYSVRGSNNGGPAGVGYTRDFPIYLSYPSSGTFLPILPEPAPPNVSNFRFVDQDGVDNSISPNVTANIQDKGNFKFTPDVDGNYEIIIDTNQDGIFGVGDKVLFGQTTANVETSVEWDGKNASGQVLPSGTYNAKLNLRIGEYHFTTFDAETSGGAANGLSIWKATGPNTRQQTLVYWDDATYLESFNGQANLTGGLSGTTQGSHTWGNFASGGIGDRNFMDTWVIGNSITTQTPAIIAAGDYNINGTLFEDYGSGNTGDNIKNTGENGIGSVTVQLFQDINNNGTYEPGTDTQVGSNVVSAADGSYNFPNLANGTYFAKVDESDGDLSGRIYRSSSNPIQVIVNNGSQTINFPFDQPIVDLTISKTDNNIDFNIGSTGNYSLTVNNIGNAPTSGTITVTDSLPTGLSAADGSLTVTGANAADWTCTVSGNTITCTSNTAIAASGSSTFSFAVNVDNNARSSVTNNVSVSGGGEALANNGNNTGSDTTNITLPATSGPTFICDGQFFLAQIPSGGNANQDPSEVSIVDTSNKALNFQFILNNPSNVFANAIGLNVEDGYMYGIDRKNQLTDRDNQDVIRIAADGTHTNLGNPYGIGSAAGDVSPDGIYYILSSKKFYKFNVTGLNSATSAGIVNIQNSSSIPGFLDIAFNPFDGNIYATHHTNDQIYIIDPDDGSWRTLTAPGFNLTSATGAMYFDPFGNFYAYQNSNGNLYKVVFDNPANPQIATAEIFVANPPDVSKNDGAACPFQPKIEKTVDPQTTPAGQSVTYTYRLTNPNGYPITTKLTDTMPSTDGRTFITVVSNSLGGTETISGDKKTLEITGLTLPRKAVNTITVTVNVPANTPATTPTSPILNQANLSGLPAIFGGTVLSDYPDDPGFSDPTPLQVTTPIASNPSVLLVKRITAINGNRDKNPNDNTPLNTFVDDTTSNKKDDDNNPNWPSNYLIGAIDGGKVKPGEEVEYTIYFLSTGDNTASNVLMCDLVPENLTFLPTAYNNSPAAATATSTNADRGIVHSYNSNTVSMSGIQDGDIGQYFSPGVEPSTVYPNIDCDGDPNTNIPNTNGAVVVNLGDLPHATIPGQSNSYGFVRFRGKVK